MGKLGSGAAQGAENSVSAVFGSEGWRCSLPALGLELRTEQPDGSLTTLPDLTDPVRARTLIENAVRAHAPAYADLRFKAMAVSQANFDAWVANQQKPAAFSAPAPTPLSAGGRRPTVATVAAVP